jgi:hypothetical protein
MAFPKLGQGQHKPFHRLRIDGFCYAGNLSEVLFGKGCGRSASHSASPAPAFSTPRETTSPGFPTTLSVSLP